jgi:uncharacterized membrane protein YqiK
LVVTELLTGREADDDRPCPVDGLEDSRRAGSLRCLDLRQVPGLHGADPNEAQAYKTRTVAEAERDARISQAEAKAKEVELGAAADAKRVKLEADANATRTKQTGEAEASASKARGDGDAAAIKAKGLAEADAIKARANALAENQDAVISQQIAQQLPQIVAEGAKAFGHIGQLTVLSGAAGLSEVFSQALGVGVAAIPMLRQLVSEGLNGNPLPKASDKDVPAVEANKKETT